MIGLDTNVLVRYLAQDDPVQSPIASEVLERRIGPDEPGFVSVVALVETVWVLDRAYGLADGEIAGVVEALLRTDHLVVEHEAAVFAATAAFKEGHGAFADALIGALGTQAGCSVTLTFDRRARRLPGFAAP